MTSIDDKLGKKRVLIVDDSPGDRTLGKLALEGAYEIDFAGDGLAATAMIKLHDYSVIISDTRMPYMNGLELYGWLDKHKPHLKDKFLLLSSTDQEGAALSGIKFMNKKFYSDSLKSIVDKMVEEK